MKKHFLSFLAAIFLLLSLNLSAYAYSGIYIDTFDGNDGNGTKADLLDALDDIEQWFFDNYGIVRDLELEQYAKVEEGNTEFTDASGNVIMQITYDPGNQTGTWETNVAIEFYIVKGGTEFAVYWLGDEGATSGDWSTEHLVNKGGNQPAISHLSAYNVIGDDPGDNPVPEPATMLLFGVGLIGVAGFSKRKIKL